MYLTYIEYTGYGGDLSEAAFITAEFKARKRIDYLTDCRVQKMQAVPEEVKLCMMSIIAVESRFSAENLANSPVIASFNTDGYSESYGSASDQAAVIGRSLDATIRELLYGVTDDKGVPLLYRGLDL